MAQVISGQRLRGVAQEVLGVVAYPGTEIMTDGMITRVDSLRCNFPLTILLLQSQTYT
jgi:hypothetical protein